MIQRSKTSDCGALIISLDFELHWGVRDRFSATGPYRVNLLGVREAVWRMLELFREFDVAVTWATVGFLFARTKYELEASWPAVRPRYRDRRLDPYQEPVGGDETSDPIHFAPSLIDAIRATPRQEIGTHTYSHYYCLEPGQDREMFRADIESAAAMARAHGIAIRSIVFPRNQRNPAYDDVLVQAGLICYRGTQNAWMHRSARGSRQTLVKRAARLTDAYMPVGDRTFGWREIAGTGPLTNVPASFFVRPCGARENTLDRLHLHRLIGSMRHAATQHRILHIWWHPHNFGRDVGPNIRRLRELLTVFAECRDRYAMQSLSMAEVAAIAGAR
jgi:peptidoglycan/xylan/chitin deacetylase (PgdA/CDA1 family)